MWPSGGTDFTGRDGVFLVDVESGEMSLLKLSGPYGGRPGSRRSRWATRTTS